MSEDKKKIAADRRKRIQNLKRLIIASLITAILLPCAGCVILFIRVNSLNIQLVELREQIVKLEENLSGSEETGVTYDRDELQSQPEIKNTEILEPEAEQEEQGRHKVYLTFDDGPSIYTADILDILAEYDVKATFFVVGKEDAASQELLKRIVEEGHTLGMHSYTHKYSELYQSLDTFSEDCTKLQEYLYQVTGVESRFYRFPGGSSNKVSNMDMLEGIDYLHSQGLEYYDWNISSGDGGSVLLSASTLLKNCMDGMQEQDSSMILLHDSASKKTTVEALPDIIENILAVEDTVILPITEDTEPVQHKQTIRN